MLTVPPSVKLWFAPAVDLRLGFDGLALRRRYDMRTFAAYIAYREDLGDGFIPYGVTRPSSKIPSCKDLTRRLVRRFKSRITKTAPVAVQRPWVQPMRW